MGLTSAPQYLATPRVHRLFSKELLTVLTNLMGWAGRQTAEIDLLNELSAQTFSAAANAVLFLWAVLTLLM